MTHNHARLAIAAALVGGALSLTGCSLLGQLLPASQPVRDAGTGEVTTPNQNADVFAVQVGDCLNSSDVAADGAQLDHVPIVPCADPHEDEVYYAYDLSDGDYPGEDAILADADSTCVDAFSSFIGLDYEQSSLDYWPLYPTSESWASGDREVLCIAWDSSGALLTGTLAGSAR